MYAKIEDEETKRVSVGVGTDTEFYKSIGMTEMEVEQDYNKNYYLKGYAPKRTENEIAIEQTEEKLNSTEKRINEIKDELLTAILLGDTDLQNELKEQYTALLAEDDTEDSTDTEEVENGNNKM